ncbi:hypothetical protein ACIA8O_39490 [Kitasatospora sp. NPDC051853]|uniref:hypothetical protein n=1 Tax=Kitasatospora sp. NPDC051853 TaxID=3364058 RepID=UPI00379B1041
MTARPVRRPARTVVRCCLGLAAAIASVSAFLAVEYRDRAHDAPDTSDVRAESGRSV